MARYSLQYATTRAEVWRWYWRAWARANGLWRFHVRIGAAVSFGIACVNGFTKSGWLSAVVVGIAVTLCCLVLFPLWPQIRFKPQVRTLEVDESGFRTTIGRLKGSRRWSEIGSVQDDGNTVVLTTSQGNAMLIPRRAFPAGIDRQQFVVDVRAWHGRAAAPRNS
jgi:hypothetical protein